MNDLVGRMWKLERFVSVGGAKVKSEAAARWFGEGVRVCGKGKDECRKEEGEES